MAEKFYGVSHIETLELLPESLEKGRAYFIDSEGYIIIDHGRGPIIYGNRPGPAGNSGENITQLQDQIDYLTDAIFNILTELARMTNSYDAAINILAQTVAKLYPESHSSEWQNQENTSVNILTTENGEQYKIIDIRIEDGAYVFELEADEETAQILAETLKAGDKVEFNNSEWDVVSAQTENGQIVIELAYS